MASSIKDSYLRSKTPDGIYCFSYKSHLPTTWQDLCTNGIHLPGHQLSSFLLSHKLPPSTSFVSALNLKQECPRSLLVGLDGTHPNQHIWIDSFCNKKTGIQSQNTYIKIGLNSYQALQAKGPPLTIPTMCILTLQKDKMLKQIQVKVCIVVFWQSQRLRMDKSKKFTPVLHLDTMRLITSMVVEKRCSLKQGNCNNAFCQGILPDDKITMWSLPLETQMPR